MESADSSEATQISPQHVGSLNISVLNISIPYIKGFEYGRFIVGGLQSVLRGKSKNTTFVCSVKHTFCPSVREILCNESSMSNCFDNGHASCSCALLKTLSGAHGSEIDTSDSRHESVSLLRTPRLREAIGIPQNGNCKIRVFPTTAWLRKTLQKSVDNFAKRSRLNVSGLKEACAEAVFLHNVNRDGLLSAVGGVDMRKVLNVKEHVSHACVITPVDKGSGDVNLKCPKTV